MKQLDDRIVLPRMALNMAGLFVNSKQVDLMLRVLKKLEERKGKMNIENVYKVMREHEVEWAEYERTQKEGHEQG